MSERPEIDWKAVALAKLHRTQKAILGYLTENQTGSPKEMSDALGEPLGNVSYHVTVLQKDGLICLSSTEPRRGALEHFYRLSEAGIA